MQKAPVMKGSGLAPVEENKSNDEVHVFGRNLEERVVAKQSDEQSPSTSFDTIVSDKKDTDDDIETIRKRKFDAITGEEDEETVFQGEFKLFAWDLPTSNWIEKGRGQLKLNDSIDQDERKSRLIMRLSGTLRIILNTAVKNSFRVINCSKTNIRFTDGQTFWAASGANINQLRDLIEERLKILAEQDKNESTKRPKPEEQDATPSKKTKDNSSVETSSNGDKSDEKDQSSLPEIRSDAQTEGQEKNDAKKECYNEKDLNRSKTGHKDEAETSGEDKKFSSKIEKPSEPERYCNDKQSEDEEAYDTRNDASGHSTDDTGETTSDCEQEKIDDTCETDKITIKVSDADEKSSEEHR